MKQQHDTEERRDMARGLVLASLGLSDLREIQDELRLAGLDVRRVTLPSGAERFVIFWRRTGTIFDSFTFYDEVSAEIVGLDHGVS